MTLSRLTTLAGLVALLAALSPVSAQPIRRPSLVVVLVVDQMRTDYLEVMAPRWTSGLKRLVTGGARFDENAYPYLQTVTCAGHATLSTGTFPATHGIILNAWWRGTRNATCTDDGSVRAIGYEPEAQATGHSALELRVPTLADRLRERSPGSQVVALSLKPRSAIMLAGRAGVVTWLDDRNVWATSTAYASTPHPEVQAFVAAHPRHASRVEVWTPMAPPAQYRGADDAFGEAPPKGWSSTFPHPLAGAPGTPQEQFDTLWETSPYADEYLGAMAAWLTERLRLGQRDEVDYLAVSFSALDYVGHAFGPDSHEAQDTLLRLDVTIGRLLDTLDRLVGPDRYVVGLSADHGAAPVPEARQHAGLEGGRLPMPRMAEAVNGALQSALGDGPHVARVEYTQVYLSQAARERAQRDPRVLDPAVEALSRLPGVDRVLRGDGLDGQRNAVDPVVRAAALSHVPGRSGELIVIPREYWVIGATTASGTTHGTHHAYDQRVPLIFYGAGIRPGRYDEPATPADLAPTLAATIGLVMPGTDGVARRRALLAP